MGDQSIITTPANPAGGAGGSWDDDTYGGHRPLADTPTSGKTVPMLFDDGTHGMVPLENVQRATKDGGKVAQYMKFDDGTQGPVPLDKVHDAMKDGGQLIGTPPQLPQPHQTQQEIDEGLVGANAQKQSEDAAKSIQLALGMSMFGGGPGLKTVEAEIPSIKTLWRIGKETVAKSDVAADEISAVGWKKFADTAYMGAEEASKAGHHVKAAAYNAAALAAKGYSHYEDAWAFIGKALPGVPIGLKILLTAKLSKEAWDYVTKGNDEDEK